MRIELDTLNQTGKRKFAVAAVTLEAASSEFDRMFIEQAIQRSIALHNRLNPHTANSSDTRRPPDRVLAHAFMGVLSEYAWKYFINLLAVDSLAKEVDSNSSKNQIDLQLSGVGKTLEIRSSCVGNGIRFAVYGGASDKYAFDVIGPYHNGYKPGETLKDYFLRALFHYGNKRLDNLIADARDSNRVVPFCIHLVGGATSEMMRDDKLYIVKALSENEITGEGFGPNTEAKTDYRVIPLPKALDALEIAKHILGASGLTTPPSEPPVVAAPAPKSSALRCSACDTEISPKVFAFSTGNLGAALCYTCQHK